MKTIIINNRNEKNPIDYKNITGAENWAEDVEALRLVASAIQAGNYSGHAAEDEKKAAFFAAEKKVLSYFKNKSTAERLPADAADYEAIIGLVAEIRKANKDAAEKEFLPRSKRAFRKRLEIFLADRLSKRDARTAEEIEAERKARREAEKERRAKKKAAEKAAKTESK